MSPIVLRPRSSFGSCLSMMCVVLAAALSGFAQTQASCTFKYFNPPTGYSAVFPFGINDFNTVVGWVQNQTGSNLKGLIRYSGGATTVYSFPNSAWTVLNRRNKNGVSVGAFGPTSSAMLPPGAGAKGFILSSTNWLIVTYPHAVSTSMTGLNNRNVMIGVAVDPNTKHEFGFMYSAGNFAKIAYPGAVQTSVTGINDNDVIVGGFEMNSTEDPWHGFIYQNGTYKRLYYGNNVWPVDINNQGTIIDILNNIHFANGTVKKVSVPGATSGFIGGINNLGTITGGYSTGVASTFKGYTAVCQ